MAQSSIAPLAKGFGGPELASLLANTFKAKEPLIEQLRIPDSLLNIRLSKDAAKPHERHSRLGDQHLLNTDLSTTIFDVGDSTGGRRLQEERKGIRNNQ